MARTGEYQDPDVPHRQHGERTGTGWPALALFLPVSLIYLEIILRLHAGLPILAIGTVYAALFAGVLASLMLLLASATARWARLVVALSLTLVTATFMTQLIYFDFFSTYYSVYSATNAGQVAEFGGDILARIWGNTGWILALAAPLLGYLAAVIATRRATRSPATWGQRGIAAGTAIVLIAVALIGINNGSRDPNSPYASYYVDPHPVTSVSQLGLITTMRLDLQRNLLGFDGSDAPPPATPAPSTPTPPSEEEPSTPNESDAPASPTEPEPVPQILDIDFEALIADAPDDEISAMHQYFAAQTPTMTNEHTGLFEGYNLVWFTAEAFSHLAVDPEVTPTLHRMVHEGYHFEDMYTPIWGVSTSDGEYVATTGLIPKSGVWSMYHSGTNSMPFAMGNQLRELGYDTYAYHNHTYDYYGRDVSHPNLGYDYTGVGNGLEVTEMWPNSDLEMMEFTLPEVLQSEPFHAYYMTVSGHLQYNFGGNAMAAKNRDLVRDLPYSEAGTAYLATQIELDRALELLLESLEDAGIAERTLIVLSSDHYPYGLTNGEIEDLAGHSVDSFELLRNSLIIYSPGMEPETVSEPTSSLDILPTVSNLMGVEFDSRLLFGRDVFSDAPPLVVLNDRSFISDIGRYNSVTGEFTPNPGETIPEGYRESISEEIDRMFYYSTKVLERDYYSLVVER